MEFTIAEYFTALFIFFGAILYSSVGHGGASAYIAIMSLMGTPTVSIKPIGLVSEKNTNSSGIMFGPLQPKITALGRVMLGKYYLAGAITRHPTFFLASA